MQRVRVVNKKILNPLREMSLAEQRELYHAVFKTEQGRKVLEHIRWEAGFDKSSVVEGDIYATHVNEGKKAIVRGIVDILESEIITEE